MSNVFTAEQWESLEIARECASRCPAEFSREAFKVVFGALTYEPPMYSEPSNVERLLSALNGPCNAITVKQTDPEFFKKICKLGSGLIWIPLIVLCLTALVGVIASRKHFSSAEFVQGYILANSETICPKPSGFSASNLISKACLVMRLVSNKLIVHTADKIKTDDIGVLKASSLVGDMVAEEYPPKADSQEKQNDRNGNNSNGPHLPLWLAAAFPVAIVLLVLLLFHGLDRLAINCNTKTLDRQ